MYFGMLFVGWDTHHTMEKWNMDVGWTSAWVHIANEGLAVISFVAILLARIYGIAWLRQLLARIFGIGGDQQQQQGSHAEMNINVLSGGDAASRAVGAPPSPPLSQRTEVELDDDMMVQSSDDSIDNGPPPSPSCWAVVGVGTGAGTSRMATHADADAPAAAGGASSSSSSSSCSAPPPPAATAGAGRRRNWSISCRPTRRGMLFCLWLQAILICFASLYYYMLYITQRSYPSSDE